MLRSKDEQIKTKDEQITTLKESHAAELKVKEEQIAALERWLPAKTLEQVDAMRRMFELQLTDAEGNIERLTNQLQETTHRSEEEAAQLRLAVQDYRGLADQLTNQVMAAEQVENGLSTLSRLAVPVNFDWTIPITILKSIPDPTTTLEEVSTTEGGD